MQTQPTDREKWKVLITDIKFNVEKRERCSYVWVCPPFRCCSCRCFATPLLYDAVVKLDDSRLSALVFSSLVYAWSRLLCCCYFRRTNKRINGTSGWIIAHEAWVDTFPAKTKASIFKSAEVRVLGRKFCHGVTNLFSPSSGSLYSHIDSVDHGKITDKLKRE